MEKTNKRTITNFLNTKYLNYAFSVLEERAIPSVIDGFKPVINRFSEIEFK